MEISDLLEPAKVYKYELKDAHRQNAEAYFNKLVEKSGIDIEKNKQYVKEYNELTNSAQNVRKGAKKYKSLQGLCIAGVVLGFILFAIGLILMGNNPVFILISIFGVGFVVTGFIFKFGPLKKKINEINNAANAIQNKANIARENAAETLFALNETYDYDMAVDIINDSLELIEVDKIFDTRKYEYMREKYGLRDNDDIDSSTEYVLSGYINHNPFIFIRNIVTFMGEETYSGSVTYTYTTSYRDSKGDVHYQTHTDTLHASITKPKPFYSHPCYCIYGNDAAPNLNFYRHPTKVNLNDEKAVEKYVKHKVKEFDELSKKALKKGGTFTPLGNDEFEALFNAPDRDNEVEFRLLFTPLAQKSMIDLLKSKEGYGDDFTFKKKKCLNIISSAHGLNLFAGPRYFYDYSYESAREKFLRYNDEYLKSIFFELAPLLSIPLYQQIQPREYIYKDNIISNYVSFEHEAVANTFDSDAFAHKDTKTDTILKAKFIRKDGDADRVEITAYSYDEIEHVEYVRKLGKDGNYHTIPIKWYEYVPLEKTSPMEVIKGFNTVQDFRKKTKRDEFSQYIKNFTEDNNMIYTRGFTSFLPNRDMTCYDIEELKKLMSKED